MNTVNRQSGRKRGFTIVEILTIMSIIVILISLLVPALHKARIFAKKVTQKNQFHAIEIGLDLFSAEFDGYPPSDAATGICGATQLCEAMVGADLMGYSPQGNYFPADPNDFNASERYGPYIQLEQANVHDLGNLYGQTETGSFDPNTPVICDEFGRIVDKSTNKRTGMPVLYYRANAGATSIANVYNYADNEELLNLGLPYGGSHPWVTGDKGMSGPNLFYDDIMNENVTNKTGIPRPYRADSYILVSAGWDAEFGTGDDVFNFEKD